MAEAILAKSGGGAASDECTLVKADVPSGMMAVTADSDDEAAEGTLDASATADTAHVLDGETFMVWDGSHWSKNNGAMTVGTLGSFSAAAYSKSQITLTWKNPAYNPKNGICFSGVIIRYKTGSYPTDPTDGTLYMGTGSNTAASGSSSYTVGSLSANTKYYFRAWPYFTCSAGNYTINSTTVMVGSYLSATATTTATGTKTVTASGTWTVPTNVRSIRAFLVGGGGGGRRGSSVTASGGGGAGYTKTTSWISVTPGDSISFTIGAGGSGGVSDTKAARGGSTSVTIESDTYTATGGYPATASTPGKMGGNGGSGGGANGSNGGSDGGNGSDYSSSYTGGIGQGTTTRAFGESGGTLYAGGGGGGGKDSQQSCGSGGSRGGGSGAVANVGFDGTANTGGGGGGGGCYGSYAYNGGSGGSGIIIIQY